MYQFVFQGSWLTGPIAPVLLSAITRLDPKKGGLIYLGCANSMSVVCFLSAWLLRHHQETRARLTEGRLSYELKALLKTSRHSPTQWIQLPLLTGRGYEEDGNLIFRDDLD
eukprot:Protomagalhaensia_wolfi_Nauph_80__2843@NODE_2948_length_936_cov_3_365663_g2313_i0_p1_GENE_NODE_2948_length_936_cov_3_365663_g2313_i0NODE_2948_length_936_cov_3_365663_g2313_i0_p1_ORF_typecomplete_len111_score5_79DUF1678/PF07913_11/0_14Nucleoside_tran/PF01733_18/0_14_NODE_2948_length_936_cov_3_365663_g2313_i0537869